jgi:pimeloyl-ACP methyl ester carboxylesterase
MPKSLSPDVVRACVVAGNTDTHYLRAGRGEPVLVLTANPDASRTLLDLLPRDFRVMAPEATAPGGAGATPTLDFAAWIRDFLDALGIACVAMIVDPCFAAPALGFALLEPDRVKGLVFLLCQCGDGAVNEGGVSDRLGQSGQRLLAMRFDPSGPAAAQAGIPEMVAFLEG